MPAAILGIVIRIHVDGESAFVQHAFFCSAVEHVVSDAAFIPVTSQSVSILTMPL